MQTQNALPSAPSATIDDKFLIAEDEDQLVPHISLEDVEVMGLDDQDKQTAIKKDRKPKQQNHNPKCKQPSKSNAKNNKRKRERSCSNSDPNIKHDNDDTNEDRQLFQDLFDIHDGAEEGGELSDVDVCFSLGSNLAEDLFGVKASDLVEDEGSKVPQMVHNYCFINLGKPTVPIL